MYMYYIICTVYYMIEFCVNKNELFVLNICIVSCTVFCTVTRLIEINKSDMRIFP